MNLEVLGEDSWLNNVVQTLETTVLGAASARLSPQQKAVLAATQNAVGGTSANTVVGATNTKSMNASIFSSQNIPIFIGFGAVFAIGIYIANMNKFRSARRRN
jgi:hypothetical protein